MDAHARRACAEPLTAHAVLGRRTSRQAPVQENRKQGMSHHQSCNLLKGRCSSGAVAGAAALPAAAAAAAAEAGLTDMSELAASAGSSVMAAAHSGPAQR